MTSAALSRSGARPRTPRLAVRHCAPPYARRCGPATGGPCTVPRLMPSQATPAPMRLEVPIPYCGRSHPCEHWSIQCRPVRDACINGGRSSRRACVPPPLALSRPLPAPTEHRPRHSMARGGHRHRPPLRRSTTASQGQPTPEIEPLGVGAPCPTHFLPRACASSPDSGEPRRPPPPGGYIAR
jgi:hypothetical protein